MSGPGQNKANVKAFYDLAFNQRQPEEAVKQYVGSSYRQHNPMAGDGPESFIGFVKWITGENPVVSKNPIDVGMEEPKRG
jgi:predicted SnoaL-like aldol condensation-catalyzing enzyme